MNIGLNDLTAKEARKICCNAYNKCKIKTIDSIIKNILRHIECCVKNKKTYEIISINEVDFFYNKKNYIKAFKKLRKLGYSILYNTNDRENINIKVFIRKKYLSRKEQKYEFKIIKNDVKRNGEYLIRKLTENLERLRIIDDINNNRLELPNIETIFSSKSNIYPYVELKNFPNDTYKKLAELLDKYDWRFGYNSIEEFIPEYIHLGKVGNLPPC